MAALVSRPKHGDAHADFGVVDLRRMARAMPAGLMHYDNPTLRVARHHEYLNLKLLDFTRRVRDNEDPRLIISLPPRHGKTTLVGRYYPAWLLGTFPEWRVIYAAYGAGLAEETGAKVRDVLAAHGPTLFNVGIAWDDSSSKTVWKTTSPHGEGGMRSTSRGGMITGFGANVLVIDDLLKDDKEARSPTITAAAWDWLRESALTRVEPGGGVLVIGTRWSQGDPIGRLIEAQKEDDWEGDQFDVINIPAIAEAGDVLGRTVGEALWPERGWTIERLKKKRASIGPRGFAALYQGNPIPGDGVLFKSSNFRYFTVDDGVYVLRDEEPGTGVRERRFAREDCSVVAFMDPAATEGELSAYTVITVWLVTPQNDLMLVDMIREKVETTKHRALMASARARWGEDLLIVVEKGAYGYHVIQEERNKGKNIRPIRAEKDKVARARVAEARFEVHKVFFPLNKHWLHVVEGELLSFPSGRYKDITDTVAYACAWTAYGGEMPAEDDDATFDMGRFY